MQSDACGGVELESQALNAPKKTPQDKPFLSVSLVVCMEL